jgi:hypothetical protein
MKKKNVVGVVLLLFVLISAVFLRGSQNKDSLHNLAGVIPGSIYVIAITNNFTTPEEITSVCEQPTENPVPAAMSFTSPKLTMPGPHGTEYQKFICIIDEFSPEEARQVCLSEEKELITRAYQNEFSLGFENIPSTKEFTEASECFSKLEELEENGVIVEPNP